MVRSALADESLLPYLQNLAIPDVCTIGLILGQPTPTKDYIIHFAKTPPVQNSDKNKKIDLTTKGSKTLNEISESWVAEHAKHATRMLPGGMYVLGVFVVSNEDLLNPFAAKFRTILTSIHKQLGANEYIYGNPDTPEKLVINYCTSTRNISCKNYNVLTSSVKPAEVRFISDGTKWTCLECKYDLDETFPVYGEKTDWTLKRHLQDMLGNINENFQRTVYLYDHEIRDENETLEMVGRRLGGGEAPRPLEVTVFAHTDVKNYENRDVSVIKCSGSVRVVGQVCSRLWMQPGQTVGAASRAVANDIVRSLAARLEMHCDSLIDGETDSGCLHEPPRRVFMPGVMMCDYLFPGEGGHEALISLHELMDVAADVRATDIVDAEGQPDLNDLYPRGDGTGVCAALEESQNALTQRRTPFIATALITALIALVIAVMYSRLSL